MTDLEMAREIALRVREAGGAAYFVGGYVRDLLLNRENKDIDIEIHGITDDMVKDSPDIGQVLPAFDSFIGDSILSAHNLEFDLKFIFYSGSHFYEKKRKYIDTLEQAKRIYPSREVDSYKLKDLCSYNYIRMVKEHSALADAFAAGRLFWKMVDEKRG